LTSGCAIEYSLTLEPVESVEPSSTTNISMGLYDWPARESRQRMTVPSALKVGIETEMEGFSKAFVVMPAVSLCKAHEPSGFADLMGASP